MSHNCLSSDFLPCVKRDSQEEYAYTNQYVGMSVWISVSVFCDTPPSDEINNP